MLFSNVKQFTLVAIISFAILSCSKDKSEITPPVEDAKTVELTSQKILTDAFYDDVSLEVMQINTESGLTNQPSQQQACATITVTPQDVAVWPKTVTIDYGNTGCTGLNGNLRKGKISYTINKKLLNTGAIITVNFDNYSVNGYKLEGVYTITNNGSANGLNVNIQLTNGKVTYPNGSWYTKSSNTNWVQSAGTATLILLDDEYNVTGNGSITSSEGNTLTAASKTNLLWKVSCGNTVSGLLDLTYNNINGTLNFGNGDCDKNAVINVAGKEYTITLP